MTQSDRLRELSPNDDLRYLIAIWRQLIEYKGDLCA